MIISIYVEREFDKIQHSFMIKICNNLGKEGMDLNMIKDIYDKPTTDSIILSSEKLKAFHLRSGIKRGCSLLPLLFRRVVEALAKAIRQEKKQKPSKLETRLSL